MTEEEKAAALPEDELDGRSIAEGVLGRLSKFRDKSKRKTADVGSLPGFFGETKAEGEPEIAPDGQIVGEKGGDYPNHPAYDEEYYRQQEAYMDVLTAARPSSCVVGREEDMEGAGVEFPTLEQMARKRAEAEKGKRTYRDTLTFSGSEAWADSVSIDRTTDWNCEICLAPHDYEMASCFFCGEIRLARGEAPRHFRYKPLEAANSTTWHYSKCMSFISKILDKNHTDIDLRHAAITNEFVIQETSVYSGTSGIGYLFLRLAQHPWFAQERDVLLEHAMELITFGRDTWSNVAYEEEAMKMVGIGFWKGLAGRIYVEALLHMEKGDDDEAESCIRTLVSIGRFASTRLPDKDDWWEGRSGFLFLALDIWNLIGDEKAKEFGLDQVVSGAAKKLWESGQEFVQKYKIKRIPLMWGSGEDRQMFLGIQRGLAGVLYSLMLVPTSILDKVLDENWRQQVDKCIDFILSHAFIEDEGWNNGTAYPEGADTGVCTPGPEIRMPERDAMTHDFQETFGLPRGPAERPPVPRQYYRFGDEPLEPDPELQPDCTTQTWANGAGGLVHFFLKAREVLGDPTGRLLTAARNCGEELWSRGLSREGVGLARGIAGNIYSFFALARCEALKEEKPIWLHRARLFAAFVTNCESEMPWMMRRSALIYERTDAVNEGDKNDYALLNGRSGVVLMLLDLDKPEDARFPLFEHTIWKKDYSDDEEDTDDADGDGVEDDKLEDNEVRPDDEVRGEDELKDADSIYYHDAE